jgi:hypothetical protein
MAERITKEALRPARPDRCTCTDSTSGLCDLAEIANANCVPLDRALKIASKVFEKCGGAVHLGICGGDGTPRGCDYPNESKSVTEPLKEAMLDG